LIEDTIKGAIIVKTIYETSAINTGGREGEAYTEDGNLKVKVDKPKEMGGTATTETNPEQLFAAGYSTCFNSALELVLKAAHKDYESSQVKAVVRLVEDPDDKNSFKLDVDLAADIKGLSQADAEKFIKIAHKHCPYSKALKGNVNVNLSATGSEG